MSSGLNYETVEALVYDPVAANRGAMRAALSALGFRHVDCVAAPVDFAYANYRRNPDIVFCEISSEDTIMCDQLQAMRVGTVGSNPFVCVVATTWEKSEILIKRVINAGADDLILRPFSNGILSMRLETLVERRKGFVITHDYIGPDRRRDPNRVSADLFDPPNVFGMKASGVAPLREIEKRAERELAAAKIHLSREKMRVDVFQIGVLGRLLHDTPLLSADFVPRRERLLALTRTVMQRGNDAKISGVDMWCKEVLSAAQGLENEVKPEETFRFLDRAATNLYQIVDPGKSLETYGADLERAVGTIRARIAGGQPV